MNNLSITYESILQSLMPMVGSVQFKVEDLLKKNGVMYHSVNSRVKSIPSFTRKIGRPDRTYHEVWDVTDLIGVRVITYFEDCVELIGKIIEDNFEVDYDNSKNKLRQNDHGYRSLHYICYLERGTKQRFEIQIRTVLQHAWAEIEHDLGYKTNEQIPTQLRRRFNQVSALLEVADREFVSLREEISEYEKARDDHLPVNSISIRTLIESQEVRRLDEKIAIHLDRPMTDEFFFADYLVRALKASGINNLENARHAITHLETEFQSFLPVYFQFALKAWGINPNSIDKGYGLLFIAHLNVLRNSKLHLDKLSALTDFYMKLDYPDNHDSASAIAKQLIDVIYSDRLHTL